MMSRCSHYAGAVTAVVFGVSNMALAAAPDVIVSGMGNGTGITKNGNVGGVTGITAYSMLTVSCNIGDANAIWIDCTSGANCNKHPVIGQQMYRLKDGRMEQIGMSWLKHGFCAADQPSCGSPYTPNGSCDWLGLHATDTYDASLNGNQLMLGPRSEVNPFTGVYPYPFILNWNVSGNAIFKRLQVHNADFDPAQNPGAQYFGEVGYTTTDEPDSNRYNNTSYRQVLVGAFVGNGYNLSFSGVINTQQTALHAWKVSDPANVTETNVDVPGDGRFVVSSKATSLGGGMWHYEYAVLNYNSDRGAQFFSVNLPAGTTVEPLSVGFHDVDYHSGEPYSLTDWSADVQPGSVTWATQTFAQNANANAIRWSTTYNFRFDCNRPPKDGEVTIGLFKAGDPASVTAAARVPDFDCNANDVGDTNDIALGTSLDENLNGVPDECDPPPPRCDGDGQCDDGDPCNGIETCVNGFCQPGTIVDCNTNGISDACDISSGFSLDVNLNGIPDECDPPPICVGDFDANGVVDVDDLLVVINSWGDTGKDVPVDLDGSGIVDVDDLLIVINNWGKC